MPYPESVQLSVDGQVTGPFNVDNIRAMISVGSITVEDYVYGEGMTDWVTVDTYLAGAPVSAAAIALSPQAAASSNATPTIEGSFIRFTIDALAYPFRGDGLFILSIGTIFFTVLNFLGAFSLYLTIAGWGYLLLMLQGIVHGTASGDHVPPSWPEFSGFGELLGKWFQFFATLVICFAPGIFLVFQGERLDHGGYGLAGLILGLGGLLYFPMAILSVAMYDSLGALNPLLVVKSIIAVKGHYLVTLMILAIVLAIQGLTTGLSRILPIAGHLLDELDALWSAVFVARVLGGLYLVNRQKLGWF